MASSKKFGCAKKAKYNGLSPLLANNTRVPSGPAVSLWRRAGRALEGEAQPGWGAAAWSVLGLGLTWGSERGINSKLFWEGNLFLLELIIRMHFSLALLSQRKAAVKCLQGEEILATSRGILQREKEGGERSWIAAPVGILVWCLWTHLPNQFRLNTKACSNIQIIRKDFRGFI